MAIGGKPRSRDVYLTALRIERVGRARSEVEADQIVLRARRVAYEQRLFAVAADVGEETGLGVAVHLAFGPRRRTRSGIYGGARLGHAANAVVDGVRGEVGQVRGIAQQSLAWRQLHRARAVQIHAPDGVSSAP